MKGWKNHSKLEYIKEYQRGLLETRGYVAIEDDPFADTIWVWWKNIGNPAGLMAGTLSSSCQLADYLRTVFLIRPKKMDWACDHCKEDSHDFYMVEDRIWLSVMPNKKGNLHITCLEAKLGRKLVLEDFTNAKANSALRFGYEMGRR